MGAWFSPGSRVAPELLFGTGWFLVEVIYGSAKINYGICGRGHTGGWYHVSFLSSSELEPAAAQIDPTGGRGNRPAQRHNAFRQGRGAARLV